MFLISKEILFNVWTTVNDKHVNYMSSNVKPSGIFSVEGFFSVKHSRNSAEKYFSPLFRFHIVVIYYKITPIFFPILFENFQSLSWFLLLFLKSSIKEYQLGFK